MQSSSFSAFARSAAGYDLCGNCKAMLIGLVAFQDPKDQSPPIPSAYMELYQRYDLLETSADAGCAICQVFFDQMSSSAKERVRVNHEHPAEGELSIVGEFRVTISKCLEGGLYGSMFLRYFEERDGVLIKSNGDDGLFGRKIRVDFIPEKSERVRRLNISSLGTSTGSAQAMKIARTWVQKCLLGHSACHRLPLFIPTRLVDCESDSYSECRLVLGHDLPYGTDYVTLSYCWGSTMSVRLLTENLDSMLRGIRFDLLPQTLRDAILTTRQLNQRYVWIDSLCIIQDSKTDWLFEAGNMASVYSHSQCNISATSSTSSSDGLFKNRLTCPYQQLKLSLNLGERRANCHVLGNDIWYREVEQAPLNSRAWVCQERFLSRCNLHFGTRQLFFECPEMIADEFFPLGIDDGHVRSDADMKLRLALLPFSDLLRLSGFDAISQTEPPTSPGRADLSSTWNQLVADYTNRHLTFPRDKLVAISGLARLFGWAKGPQDQYLAGLWSDDLATELLWFCHTPHREHDKVRREYTAPTWSWAAIDGGVSRQPSTRYRGLKAPHGVRVRIEIDDFGAELCGEDVYGAVKAGWVVLKGPLANVRLSDGEVIGNRMHNGITAINSLGPSHTEDGPSFDVYWDKGPAMMTPQDRGKLNGLIILPVNESYGGPKSNIAGLVLCPTETSHVFQRVGFFSSSDPGAVREACRGFDDGREACGLEFEGYAEDEYRYKITII